MNAAATKRLKAAKGNHAAAVRTAVRGLARADAHTAWLNSDEMAEFTTEADRVAAAAEASELATVVAMLVLDAPEGTFNSAQLATARRALGAASPDAIDVTSKLLQETSRLG